MFIGTVLGKVPANGKGLMKAPLENEWTRYVETSRHGIKKTDKTMLRTFLRQAERKTIKGLIILEVRVEFEEIWV